MEAEALMITIVVPDELAGPLAEEAGRRGTTPELLALEGVRRVLLAPSEVVPAEGSLLDFLSGHLEPVDGSSEPWSQACGRKFADGLAERRPARP
jgi:hypothetical protein